MKPAFRAPQPRFYGLAACRTTRYAPAPRTAAVSSQWRDSSANMGSWPHLINRPALEVCDVRPCSTSPAASINLHRSAYPITWANHDHATATPSPARPYGPDHRRASHWRCDWRCHYERYRGLPDFLPGSLGKVELPLPRVAPQPVRRGHRQFSRPAPSPRSYGPAGARDTAAAGGGLEAPQRAGATPARRRGAGALSSAEPGGPAGAAPIAGARRTGTRPGRNAAPCRWSPSLNRAGQEAS